MAEPYRTGTKPHLIITMAHAAMKDRKNIIAENKERAENGDKHAKALIKNCRDEIRDFRRIKKQESEKIWGKR